ncbi:MAG: hypothetical protein Q4D57_02390 [Clostridia bacterium]|nr:hypothetical protein [Clostridia bacterium]
MAEDHINKFNEFNINLTKKEAEDISKVTDKLLSPSVEKLDDKAVEDIVGGTNIGTALGITVGTTGFAAATGTLVAGIVYHCKCIKANKNGDYNKASKYMDLRDKLCYAAIGSLIVAKSGGAIAYMTGDLIDDAIKKRSKK